MACRSVGSRRAGGKRSAATCWPAGPLGQPAIKTSQAHCSLPFASRLFSSLAARAAGERNKCRRRRNRPHHRRAARRPEGSASGQWTDHGGGGSFVRPAAAIGATSGRRNNRIERATHSGPANSSAGETIFSTPPRAAALEPKQLEEAKRSALSMAESNQPALDQQVAPERRRAGNWQFSSSGAPEGPQWSSERAACSAPVRHRPDRGWD